MSSRPGRKGLAGATGRTPSEPPVIQTPNGKCALRSSHPLAAGMPWHRATSDLSDMGQFSSCSPVRRGRRSARDRLPLHPTQHRQLDAAAAGVAGPDRHRRRRRSAVVLSGRGWRGGRRTALDAAESCSRLDLGAGRRPMVNAARPSTAGGVARCRTSSEPCAPRPARRRHSRRRRDAPCLTSSWPSSRLDHPRTFLHPARRPLAMGYRHSRGPGRQGRISRKRTKSSRSSATAAFMMSGMELASGQAGRLADRYRADKRQLPDAHQIHAGAAATPAE